MLEEHIRMARHQQLIDKLLDQNGQHSDHSLRAKALNRALSGKVPRTLTPWEWQDWIEQNGVPDWPDDEAPGPKKPWWRRWL